MLVVFHKISASPKRPFLEGGGCFMIFFYTYIFISFLFLKTTPTSNPKGGGGGGGGAYYPCILIFLLGHIQIWPKRGGGGGGACA